MQRYGAFLRGMNLGGRRVTNDDLITVASGLGFDEVGCFRASGNLALSAPEQPVQKLASALEDAFAAAFGYEVPVFIRTAAEVRAIALHAPFDSATAARYGGKLQVCLLHERPSAAAGREALALSDHDDALALDRSELFWLPSGGMSDSELDLKAIGRLLGPMTIRTKGTLEQMAGKLFAVD